MNHLGTKTIETKRLILRRFKRSDAEDMYINWTSDEEVTKYFMWATHKNLKDSKEYIDFLIKKHEEINNYDWLIELKETNKAIGQIGVGKFNESVESAHIYYLIGREWWNKGIVSEAFSAVIKYLIEDVGVNRIEARHDTSNIYSGKVMEKCGLKYEGTLREAGRNNIGICDEAWYGLLKKDYNINKNN